MKCFTYESSNMHLITYKVTVFPSHDIYKGHFVGQWEGIN